MKFNFTIFDWIFIAFGFLLALSGYYSIGIKHNISEALALSGAWTIAIFFFISLIFGISRGIPREKIKFSKEYFLFSIVVATVFFIAALITSKIL
ncbi:hypothetical protein [Parendozoicomonas haliclonae]|uniref:hypothetical protein n=1 Tax=Parendozoicomonas haliclonae TaxID=1960125 RepID=UPI000B358203|nr:hypothetical protein [Parendozoicomonas haliclonae]